MNREVIDLTNDDMPVRNLKLSFELVGDELVEMGEDSDSDVDTVIDEVEDNLFINLGVLNRNPLNHYRRNEYLPLRFVNPNVFANVPQLADRFLDHLPLRSRLNRTPVNLEDIETNNTNCPVCFTDTEEQTRCVTNCAHAFCMQCLKNWEDILIANGKPFTCPCCRDPIHTVYVNHAITRIKLNEDSSGTK